MRAVHIICVAVAAVATLAGPGIVAAYAEPIPVAPVTDGMDGFAVFDTVLNMAIHDISNRTYAVVAGYEGVHVINITDPAAPLSLAVISSTTNSRFILQDIAVHDISARTYALAVRSDVQITDITNPTEPLHVSTISYDPDRFAAMNQPEAVDVYDASDRTYAVVAGRSGVQIIDITSPDNPVSVGDIGDGELYSSYANVNDVIIREVAGRTYALVTESEPGPCGLTCTSFYGLNVVDITNPSNPLPYSLAYSKSVEYAGDDGIAVHDISNRTYAFLTSASVSVVDIVDITDPADTLHISSIRDDAGGFTELGRPHGIAVHDISNRTYAVVASAGDDGVQVIDITDPADPVPVAAMNDDTDGFTALGSAHAVAIHDISNRTYAVVGGSEGIQIIDITHPVSTSPTMVSEACNIPTTASIAHLSHSGLYRPDDVAIYAAANGTYAVVATNGRVQISDITHPANPVHVAVINYNAADVTVHDISNRTYAVAVSKYGGSVQINDITNPADPLPVAAVTDDAGGFTELAGASGIAVHDISNRTYALVSSRGDNGVQIIDITQPDSPLPVAAVTDDAGGFTELAGASGIAVHDISNRTYAVVASEFDDGIQVIDITNPADPLPAVAITDDTGGFTKLNGAISIAISNISNMTYGVVAGYEGVQVIDITNPANPLPAAWLHGGPTAAIHDVSGEAYLLVNTGRYTGVDIFNIAHLGLAGCLYN